MHQRSIALLSLLVLIVVPSLASAHGEGASFETESNGYVLDIGYEPELPQAGERMLFDVALIGNETKKPVPYDRAWIRLEVNGVATVATGLADSPIGPTTLLLLLPHDLHGNAVLTVRFEKNEESIAEASFPFTVTPAEKQNPSALHLTLIAILSGLVGGAVLLWAAQRRNAIVRAS